jgi:hypothetical protein
MISWWRWYFAALAFRFNSTCARMSFEGAPVTGCRIRRLKKQGKKEKKKRQEETREKTENHRSIKKEEEDE